MATEKVFPMLTASTMSTGDLIYYDTDEFQKVSVSTDGKVLTTVLGKPAWVDNTTVQYLDATYSCKVRKASTFAVADNTVTMLTWTGAEEQWDGAAFHDGTTATNRLTIPSGGAGVYYCTFSGWWAANATGIRGMFLYAKTSAGFVIEAAGSGPVPGNTVMVNYHHASLIVDMDETDYFEVQLLQTSGGSLSLQSQASLTIIRIAESQ